MFDVQILMALDIRDFNIGIKPYNTSSDDIYKTFHYCNHHYTVYTFQNI